MQHVLEVVRSPAVWQQRLQIRFPRAQPQQNVPQIRPRFKAMTLRSRQDGEQYRRSRAGIGIPRNSQFFLPIAWSRNVRSETLLSIVSRPSLTYCRNAAH